MTGAELLDPGKKKKSSDFRHAHILLFWFVQLFFSSKYSRQAADHECRGFFSRVWVRVCTFPFPSKSLLLLLFLYIRVFNVDLLKWGRLALSQKKKKNSALLPLANSDKEPKGPSGRALFVVIRAFFFTRSNRGRIGSE